jgi:hypothetical protein
MITMRSISKFINADYLVAMTRNMEGKKILGPDMATIVMRYGIICIEDSKISLVQYGIIHLNKYTGMP